MKHKNILAIKMLGAMTARPALATFIVLSSACIAIEPIWAEPETGLVEDSQARAENVDIGQIKQELSKARSGNEKMAESDKVIGSPADQSLERENKRLLAAENELLAKMQREEVKADDSNAGEVKAVSLDSSERASANLDRATELDAAIDQLTAPASKEKALADTGIEVVKDTKSKPAPMPAKVAAEAEDFEPLDINDRSAPPAPSTEDTDIKYSAQVKALETLRTSQERMKNQLDSSQKKATQLQKELEETRNRLIVAETEVERLSSMLAERNKSSISKITDGAPKSSSPMRAPVTSQQEAKMAPDMPIATVMVEKAHLRTGPGKDNSPLMAVSRGTRLAVETRNGDWYRVIAPTGARAWVSSDMLAFGPSAQTGPTRTVKIKGYQSNSAKAGF